MKVAAWILGVMVAFGLAGPVACSSDDEGGDDAATSATGGTSSGSGATGGGTTGCAADPLACPAGQTCWVAKQGTTFECLGSGQGALGDECQNYVDQPTCGDGLTCFSAVGYPTICTPFCDLQKPDCPEGFTCVLLQIEKTGAAIEACAPPKASTSTGASGASAGSGAGGGDAASGSAGAGGDEAPSSASAGGGDAPSGSTGVGGAGGAVPEPAGAGGSG